MAKENKPQICPTCGSYTRTGIHVQHDGMRILFQWKGGILDQRFTFDPRLRQESEGDFPKIFKYVHKILGMWEQWMQRQLKVRNQRPTKIIVPGVPKIIKGELNIDLSKDMEKP